MNRSTTGSFAAVALSALASTACAGKLAPPFDALKTANVTAYRLQNYEPPSPVPGAPIPGAAGGGIPGLPPEISQWVQGGAGGLQQLLPPGLLPPGMFGGQQQGQQPASPRLPGVPDPTPRFHNFRILQQTPVLDPDLKEELAKVFGREKNFDSKHANCLYAEMGLSFVPGPGAMPNDILISYSCNQVAAQGFAWPHPNTGMTPSAVEDLTKIVQQLWPPGT
jgi:hypothetical protein